MRRNATLFVLISLLSGFGGGAMTLAAGVWILELTGSVPLAALTGIFLYAPTLAAPWLGTLVDRLPRRPLVIGVDLALAALLLTLLAVRGDRDVWLIFLVLLLRGVGYVLSDAGESALLPAALPATLLGDVNGWRSSAQEGTKLVAPLAGAGLYAWAGPVPVILLSAAIPLLSAACYALLRVNATPRGATAGGAKAGGATAGVAAVGSAVAGNVAAGGVVADETATAEPERGRADTLDGVWAGLRILLRERAVRVPVLVAAAAIPLSGLTNAALLSRLVDGLHLPATHLGFLASAQGAGSIVSGLLVGRLLSRLGPARVAAIGAVVFAAGVLAWCLPWWPAMIAGSVVVGLGLPWTLIAAITAVQTGTPDHLLGRASATSTMLMFGPVALAIPLGAALVHLGARPPLIAVAVLAVTAGLSATRRRAIAAEPVIGADPPMSR
jgi:MFS family permease